MAFTTADRDAVQAAMVTMAVEGIATVSVDGQTVTTKSMAELERLLRVIETRLSPVRNHRGLRITKLVPPGTGG